MRARRNYEAVRETQYEVDAAQNSPSDPSRQQTEDRAQPQRDPIHAQLEADQAKAAEMRASGNYRPAEVETLRQDNYKLVEDNAQQQRLAKARELAAAANAQKEQEQHKTRGHDHAPERDGPEP